MNISRDYEDSVIRNLPSWSSEPLADAWATGEWPTGRYSDPKGLWDKDFEPGPMTEVNPKVYQHPENQSYVLHNRGEVFNPPPIPDECGVTERKN